MKKVSLVALFMVLMLCFSAVAMASNGRGNGNVKRNSNPSHEPKSVEVAMPTEMTVVVGEEVTITATTEKKGSRFEDLWTGAEKEEETVLKDGYYISTALFNATEPGQYEIMYSITMRAGNSHVTFEGESTLIITVVAPEEKKVVDFEIEDSHFIKQGNSEQYQLVVTKLSVKYCNETTEIVELEKPLVVGGFSLNQQNRRFDLKYAGITKQFTMNGPTE